MTATRSGIDVPAVGVDDDRTVTDVEIILETGRTHQIRRQLAGAGHPVLGDPCHGRGNKNRDGLRLVARALGR